MNRIALYFKRHSPTILTCISAVGVVVTAAMAIKATPKAMRLIEEERGRQYEEECSKNISQPLPSFVDFRKLTPAEILRTAWKCYIPSAIIGAATIFCIFGANVLNKRKQASLASAYALLNQSYQRYRKAANSVFGEDADLKIRIQAAKETYISADGYVLYSPDEEKTEEKILFYDSYSQRYFTATMAAVLNAQYHINRNLSLRGEVVINELYEFLGIDGIKGGNLTGWSMEELTTGGVLWLDFQNRHVTMDDGLECYIVSALWEPSLLENDGY